MCFQTDIISGERHNTSNSYVSAAGILEGTSNSSIWLWDWFWYSFGLSAVFLLQECKSVEKGGNFYHFRYNTRSVKSTIVHFQVKLLLNWGNYLICCFKIWFIRQWLVLSALLGSVSFFYGSQGCSIFNDPCDTDSVDVLLLVCNTAEKLSVGNIKAWCVSHA